MDINRFCPLATHLAERIRASRDELTTRWLERIAERVQLDEERIFPSDALLDHVPILMVGIADYLENPQDEITADMPVIAKAMELGQLRFSQGFDAGEILKEYEILGGVLFSFCERVVAESAEPCPPRDLLVCSHRLFRAVSVIEQVTTTQYLRKTAERVGEREERLRRFNRMITHELKNRVGATLGAGQLLQEEWLGREERLRFAAMVTENAQEIQKVLENLVALSKLDSEQRRQRHIVLRQVVREVFRQLRELSSGRDVELRMAPDMPDIEVSAAALELCLSNYLSNAIKYSDPDADERWAVVEACILPTGTPQDAHCGDATSADDDSDDSAADARTDTLVVRVRDNGLGVPADRRDRLFERFFRAHEDQDAIEGTGLGLNLVRETIESLGGRTWAEFDQDKGSVFAFSLPCRFNEDGSVSCVAPARARDPRPGRRVAEEAKASG